MMYIMIGAEWCGSCQQKKVLLDREDIGYIYIDVESSHEISEAMMKRGIEKIPYFMIVDRGEWILGTNSVKKFISEIRQIEDERQ